MNRPIDPDDLRGALRDLAAAAPTGDDALLARTHERIGVHRRRRIAAAVTGGVAALALVVGGVAVVASDDDGLLVETPDPADTPTTPPAPDPLGSLGPPDGILTIDVRGVATVYDAATLEVDEDRSGAWRAAFDTLGGGVLELHHTGGAGVVALVDRDDPEGCLQVAHVWLPDGEPAVADLARSNDATASPAGVAWLVPCPDPDDAEILHSADGRTTRFGEARLQDLSDLALSADDRLAAVACTEGCQLLVAAYDPEPVGDEPGPWPFVTPAVPLDDAPCEAGDAARVAWLGARIATWSNCADAVMLYEPAEQAYAPGPSIFPTNGASVLALDGEPSGERLLVVAQPPEGVPSLVLVGPGDAEPRTIAQGVVAATWIWSESGDAPPQDATTTSVPPTTDTAPDTTVPATAPDTSVPDTTTPSGPVAVPDVVGLHQDGAIAVLETAGFDVVLQGDEGDVFWQEPPAGAIVGAANRRVTIWSCGPGANCVIPPPSWLDDPSTTAWGPLAGPAWEEIRATDGYGADLDDAISGIRSAFQPTSEIWTLNVVVLSQGPPSAEVLVLERGTGDDAASGADHRVTLVMGIEGWALDGGQSRSRCTRGVTPDGLCL